MGETMAVRPSLPVRVWLGEPATVGTAAILRRDPRFTARVCSPVRGLFTTLLTGMSARNEGAVFIGEGQRGVIPNRLIFSASYGCKPLNFGDRRVAHTL